jgi:hypothetical protein
MIPLASDLLPTMIPLASDLLPFPGQMQREDHLKSASLPDRAFFIWPQHNAVQVEKNSFGETSTTKPKIGPSNWNKDRR